jgi:hypothetical protein
MPLTKQQTALACATQLVSICTQFQTLFDQIALVLDEYDAEQYENFWNNMSTAVQNADGSIGAADGTPNPAHPITIGSPPLYRSANALIAGIVVCQDFQKFWSNQAVATANRSQSVEDLVA